jgi:Fic family protein
MASNRLTRNQVLELYRTGKISVAFEPMKVDDIYEIDNHFRACTYVIDNLLEPLHTAHLRKLHSLLFYGTEADRNGSMRTGEFRSSPHKYGLPPEQISKELSALIKEYEAKKKLQLADILDFHVRFERIHPFEDGNGRLGRLIMMKECLRHQIVPFIYDDKHRGKYNRGIQEWVKRPDLLMTETERAQNRLQNQMDTCRLLEYCRPEEGRGSRKGGKKK